MSPTQVQSLDELYAAAPGALAELVGATNWVTGIVDGHNLVTHLPHVQGFFSPRTGQVVLHPDVGASLASFFAPRASAGTAASEAAELWNLKLVKTHLALLTSRIAQGLGPSDPALMRAEWDALWSHPQAHSIVFGLSELVSELFVDHLVIALGMDRIDPRLLQATSLRQRYVAQATLLRHVLSDLAAGLRSSLEQEVCHLIRDGGSQLAVWRLTQRWTAHAELGAPGKLRRPHGLVDLRQVIELNLAGLTREWADAA